MKLLTRGILVIAVPLVSQLVLVSWLVKQFSQVQSQTAEVVRSREIAATANMIFMRSVQEQLMSGVGGGIQKSGEVKDEQLKSGLEKLRALSLGDSSRVALEGEVEKAANNLLNTSKRLQKDKRDSLKNPKARGSFFTGSLVADVLSFFKATTKEIEHEQTGYRSGFIETKNLIQVAISGTIYFWIAGVVLSVLFAWFYATSIRRPIIRLQKNAQLLAEREALLPPLSGTNEFVTLDRLIQNASEELRQALLREKELLANVPAVICSFDSQDRFISANTFAASLFGASPRELIGRSLYEFVRDVDLARADSEVSNARSANGAKTFDIQIKRADGRFVETSWSLQCDKKLDEMFCVIFDITEAKEAERLKENFIDMVSRDLKSPLSSMLGIFTSLAQGEFGEIEDKVASEIQNCLRSLSKLIDFIDDFLQFQKFQEFSLSLNLEQHSLREIVMEAVTENKVAADKKELRIVVRAFESSITCDRIKVLQVINNFLTNAIKFSPPGAEIVIYLSPQGNSTALCIADSGPGIPTNFLTKIFEPFEQVPGELSVKGFGLGLAICKMIAEAHGWALAAENRAVSSLSKGEPSTAGSIFSISIPNAHLYGRLL